MQTSNRISRYGVCLKVSSAKAFYKENPGSFLRSGVLFILVYQKELSKVRFQGATVSGFL